MSDAEHQFDPHWPHGHGLFLPGGNVVAAHIISTDSNSATHKIVAEYETSHGWLLRRFKLDGVMEGYTGTDCARLINRPAPEPVVVDTLCFMNSFASPQALDVAGRPIRANIEVTCKFMSDGTVRATAEVIK